MMLQQVTEYLDDMDGVDIRFRIDGSLFNLRRLQVQTNTKEIRELLFAATLVAGTESAMQRITSYFTEAAQLFGLEVSLKKAEVLHQSARVT